MNPKTDSDDFMFILNESMLEILGPDDLREVTQQAHSEILISLGQPNAANDLTQNTHVSRLLAALQNKYGLPGGLGLGFRIGRVLFTRILRTRGEVLGVAANSFRLLPQPKKIRTGLNIFSKWLQDQSDQTIQIEALADRITWRVHPCPDCRERTAHQPICSLTAGFLHEAMSWFSGGKFYKVTESECKACGYSRCSFEIRLEPIQ